MSNIVVKIKSATRRILDFLKKIWSSERLMLVTAGVLVGVIVLISGVYNLISKPVQINQIMTARVGLQELVNNLNEVTDIRNAEIGQKDTLPKTVYQDLVLLQAEMPKTPELPSPWATNLFVDNIPELDGKTISEVYASLDSAYRAYGDATYNYLRLLFATQARIEYNFLSDFAFSSPELPDYGLKIDTAEETVDKEIETLKNFDISDKTTVGKLTTELAKINELLELFRENEDIEKTRTGIEASQRNIVNILADYWDTTSEATFLIINEANSDLSFIESALK